jgi:hypothetical protein
MNAKRSILILAAGLLAGSAWAQTATKPLNLKLPPSDLPAPSSTAANAPAAASTAAHPVTTTAANSKAPGVYYGDTSGRTYHDEANAFAPGPPCDDATYNDAQMHGSINTGVVSASHAGTGTYEGGEVNITKNLGSCDHHTGSIGVSIGVEQSHFHGRGF